MEAKVACASFICGNFVVATYFNTDCFCFRNGYYEFVAFRRHSLFAIFVLCSVYLKSNMENGECWKRQYACFFLGSLYVFGTWTVYDTDSGMVFGNGTNRLSAEALEANSCVCSNAGNCICGTWSYCEDLQFL